MRRRKRWSGERSSGGNLLAKLLTGIAVALIVVVLFDLRMRPMIEEMLAYQAGQYAMRTINSAMLRELERTDLQYDDIARLTRDSEGMVTSVQTDIVAVNRLKAQMADAVLDELEQLEGQVIRIPIGTLLGNQITSGRGPEVEVRVIPVGYVQSELYNRFESAGINQTLHQVVLQTGVQMVAILPGYTVKTETATSFCVAETVIVGTVPDGYTIVGQDDSSTISKVNDYKADP